MFCLVSLPFRNLSRFFASVPSRTVLHHRYHVSEPYHVSQGLCPTNPSFSLTCGMQDVGAGLIYGVISRSESPLERL